jgi:hypothetical protein
LTDDTQAAAPAAAPADPTTSLPNPNAPQAPEPAPVAPPVTAEGDDDDGEGDTPELGKPLSKSQQRRQARKAEFEALKAEVTELRSKVQPPAPKRELPIEDRVGPPPDPRHYQNAVDYQAARAGWEADKRYVTREMARERAVNEEREAAYQTSLARSYEERRDDARERLPDYDKVVGAAALEVSTDVQMALLESEITPDLEYHLAKNPEKLRALNKMTPTQVAKEIGRLEVLLTKPAQNKATQAPPPVQPLKGGSAGPAKTYASMDMDEYVAARRAEQKRA